MASKDSYFLAQHAEYYRISNYVNCAASLVVIYRFLLNVNQEVALIWKEGSSKRFMALYGLLTYGGLLQALIIMLTVIHPSYNTCLLWMVLVQGFLPAALPFGLNLMMAIRVYAMYNKGRRVFMLLAICFVIPQALGMGGFISLVCENMVVEAIPPFIGGCYFDVSATTARLISSSAFATCGYELILLVMVLFRVMIHLRARLWFSLFSVNDLVSVLARDHTLYFLLASAAWIIQAISLLPSLHLDMMNCDFMTLSPFRSGEELSQAGQIAWVVFSITSTTFVSCMLGPIMLLNIRRFDAASTPGHGIVFDAVEIETVDFGLDGSQLGA